MTVKDVAKVLPRENRIELYVLGNEWLADARRREPDVNITRRSSFEDWSQWAEKEVFRLEPYTRAICVFIYED